jgi:hypothetical protein
VSQQASRVPGVLQHKEQSHGLVGSLYSGQLFAIKEGWSRADPVEVGDVILVHQDAQLLSPNLRIMAGAGADISRPYSWRQPWPKSPS